VDVIIHIPFLAQPITPVYELKRMYENNQFNNEQRKGGLEEYLEKCDPRNFLYNDQQYNTLLTQNNHYILYVLPMILGFRLFRNEYQKLLLEFFFELQRRFILKYFKD
jgi:hypothetical protein